MALSSITVRNQPQGMARPAQGIASIATAPVTYRPRASVLLSDEDLLVMTGNGDTEAFRILTARHAGRAYAVALRMTANAADAEDVVQDTMLKIWSLGRNWEGGRARFSTWLYRVIVNRCIDLKRRPQGEDIEAIDEPAAPEVDAVDELIRAEAARRLTHALAELPDQQQAAMILSYYEDRSNAEIADRLATSVMAVESLLKRGRTYLRRRLQRDGAELLHSLKNH